jgi:lipid-A-disaccharide synthase
MKVMICAGETSGDLHGAFLVRALKSLAPETEFFGLGGRELEAAGVRLEAHLRDTAVMGLTEVLGSLRKILRIRRKMLALLESEKPAALVVIDSPDFNFPLVRRAHLLHIPAVYYICPQLWAWRAGRLKFLEKYTARRAVIFPFEKDFYTRKGAACDLVGHPLLDELPPPRPRSELLKELGLPDAPLLAILPGSRLKIASRLLGPMLEAAALLLKDIPDLRIALPRAQSLAADKLAGLLARGPDLGGRLAVYDGQSQKILAASQAALCASGTSTVEGTLLGVPMIAAYITSALSFFLARRLVRVPFVSITNLLLNRRVLPELFQGQVTGPGLAAALRPLLLPGPRREAMLSDLRQAAELLGPPGASLRTAAVVLEEIRKNRGA